MKRLLLIFISIISISVFAQDQKANSILEKVSKTTKAYKSITADFNFTMSNKEVDLLETNKGKIIVQGEKYKLNFSGVEIYCDSESQWTYMPDAEEVNISEAGFEDSEMLNPATIFTIYENGFINTYLGEFSHGSTKTHKIELVPTEEKEFSRVIIEIDQVSNQIIEATMFGVDNNTYTITITNMKTTNKYPESTFKFLESEYPDVEVIDMR